MDMMIFYCVTLILNKNIKFLRIILAATIASLIYCMLVLLPILQVIPYGIYSLFIPIVAILYLYKPKSFKVFTKLYLVCMLVAAVFGGVIFNIWFTFNHSLRGMDSIGFSKLILIGALITSCFYMGFYFIRRRLIFPTFEYQLILKDKGKYVEIKALLDTGNLLYTPISHKPVIVVEYESIKPLLSKIQQTHYEKYRKSRVAEMEEALVRGECKPEVLIPFNSIGCQAGYLWGVKIEQMIIKRVEDNRTFSGCVIGISNEPLFSDQQYHALLHPEFIIEEAMAS